MDKKSSDKCTKKITQLLLSCGGVLVAIMVVATSVFIFKGCSSQKYGYSLVNDTIKTGAIHLVKFTPNDSAKLVKDGIHFIPAKDFHQHVDSLNKILLTNQKNLYERQGDLVADIRQETNNNLDKMSAWLAFWITVLGFIGVACPIAY